MKKFFIFLICIFCFQIFGSNFYIRSGASGSNNGSDWNNAWTDVTSINWTLVSPGDNIWIAGGTYGTLNIGKSGTSGNKINIYRVRTTNSVPTSATGWNSSYDAQPSILEIHDSGFNYINIDGQVPYVGILVTNSNNNNDSYSLSTASGANNVTVLNCDIVGCGYSGLSTVGESRCYNSNGGGGLVHDNRIAYCTLRNAPTLISTITEKNLTIEHCIMHSNLSGNTATHHPNFWQTLGCTNITLRWCVISNWQAEGIMMDFISSSDDPNDTWNIYGNLWIHGLSTSRVLEPQYKAQYNIKFFNNTVVTNDFGIRASANGGSWHSSCQSSNNIFLYAGTCDFGTVNSDYNLTSSGTVNGSHSIVNSTISILSNLDGDNYHIVSTIGTIYPRNKGADLGSSYNTDFDGNTRGSDGTWDIGAYEYITPSPGNTLTPLGRVGRLYSF